MTWPNDPSLLPPMTVADQLTAIKQAALNDGQPLVAAQADRVLGLSSPHPVTPNPEAAVNRAFGASVAVPPQWGRAQTELTNIL